MKKKILHIIILIGLTFNLIAQNDLNHVDSLIQVKMNQLKIDNIDTICVYKDFCVGCFIDFTNDTDGCTYSGMYYTVHIFWINNKINYCTRIDNCFSFNTLIVDSIRFWNRIFANKRLILNERLKPFQYISKGQIVDLDIDHDYFYEFSILINKSNIHKQLYDFQFEQELSDHSEKNINFGYNNKTQTKLLQLDIDNDIRRIYKMNKFKKDK